MPSPEGPLTREEARALLTVCLANLRGQVIAATELPDQVGTGMWKLRRIAGAAAPAATRRLG